jgi:hypothetical protein
MKFSCIIVKILVMLSTGLILKLTLETVSSKKKVCLLLLPPFYIGRGIRDKTSRIRNTGHDYVFRIDLTTNHCVLFNYVQYRYVCSKVLGNKYRNIFGLGLYKLSTGTGITMRIWSNWRRLLLWSGGSNSPGVLMID